MAWPNLYARGPEQIERAEKDNYTHIISNVDLHDQNMMFGSLNADGSPEHRLTPILKMIDVGECQRQRTRGESQWLTKTAALLDGIADQISDLVTAGLRTSARDVPLDAELSNLAMMSSWDQADLRVVAADVIAAVSTRTQAWYRERYPGYNVDLESDASIRDLVKAIFFDADRISTRL
ncbi:hypothetical protein PG994_000381 [Apiospora phragmitis]|uniref:Uncharacterized protein n=1 Tax=Apiospora phragmitis TaxID=2905665 RepID=A0ABR1X611_9PEZI